MEGVVAFIDDVVALIEGVVVVVVAIVVVQVDFPATTCLDRLRVVVAAPSKRTRALPWGVVITVMLDGTGCLERKRRVGFGVVFVMVHRDVFCVVARM